MSDEKYLIDKRLDSWLNEQPPDCFPPTKEATYQNKYERISQFLNNNVHSEAELSALIQEIRKSPSTIPYDQLIYLNNHGPGHVDQVIDRATELIIKTNCMLSAYEVYLLLISIHFHDVGNIFGRDSHEVKSIKVMRELGNLAGNDEPEKRVILDIAAAHCGNYNGDRDKIGRLERSSHLLGKHVRYRLLAGILRLADELADDSSRSSRFAAIAGLIPPGSEIFHAYSSSLHTVVLDGSDVRLAYEFDKQNALRRFIKNDNQVFLFDEILARVLKMHIERSYCMRFLRPEVKVPLERILVKISICNNFDSCEVIETLDLRTFSLEEKGYPLSPVEGIVSLCPDLNGITGQMISEKLSQGD